MFSSIGRRMALLNAVVVVTVIAIVAAVTYVLLQESLDREADVVLADRAAVAAGAWEDRFKRGTPESKITKRQQAGDADQRDSNHDDDDDDKDPRGLLESSDVLLFAVAPDGRLLADAQGDAMPGLPDGSGVAAALGGKVDARTIPIGGEIVRVYTEPVRHDDRIIGVVQAARNEREHQAELRLIGMISLVGIGLGAVVAVPAGWFLARRAMRPIDQAFARQRAFVADASHELRTPLTLIRATTELVQRLPETPPPVREELAGVLAEVDSTSRLVDDLLLLARLDSTDVSLRREVVDLGGVIRAAAQPLLPLAEAARLTLALDLPAGIMVDADADRIRQVVRILLDNAIAYTPRGGSVRLSIERRGARAMVMVRDTGAGIAPRDRPHVFDRFYRADRARSRATGGTGLGLAIARALIQAHGGEIGLDSETGAGTAVWFALPLVLA